MKVNRIEKKGILCKDVMQLRPQKIPKSDQLLSYTRHSHHEMHREVSQDAMYRIPDMMRLVMFGLFLPHGSLMTGGKYSTQQ